MTKLILIRHGETTYNKENRYCGISDPELNNTGVAQAESLGRRVRGLKVEKVYSSDLRRAVQTASIAFNVEAVEHLPDFREIDFGIFESLRYDEIIKKHKEHYINWTTNLIHGRIPQGETLSELFDRVRAGLSRLLSQNKYSVAALVSHGGPIRVLLCDALKLGMDSFWQIEQRNAALNIIDYSDDQEAAIETMDDISHL
ncbi:MAG: histidine phosphatase family protein [Candidatus Omnitrophota bacterium]